MSGDVRFNVGLDLGPPGTPTALAVLARPRVHAGDPPTMRRPAYAVRHLRRFPVGTPYPQIVDAVRELLRTPPLPGAFLTVDQTGVGRAVSDLFWDGFRGRVTCRAVRVTITGGVVAGIGAGIQIPKQELIGTVQVLLQTTRLLIPRDLPDSALLVRELEAFRLRPPHVGTSDPLAAWRDGPQDDLVLAIALAAYVGEKQLPKLHEKPPLPRQHVA